ncbi:MAG: DNA translocase FtsK [Spirochaetes bacterium]|nr:DNA translocase FtsK [Spirochaetota bacterium]
MKLYLKEIFLTILVVFCSYIIYLLFFTEYLNFLVYIFGISFKLLPFFLIINSIINLLYIKKKYKQFLNIIFFSLLLLPIFIKSNIKYNFSNYSLFENFLKNNSVALIFFNISFIFNFIYMSIILIDLIDYINASILEKKLFQEKDIKNEKDSINTENKNYNKEIHKSEIIKNEIKEVISDNESLIDEEYNENNFKEEKIKDENLSKFLKKESIENNKENFKNYSNNMVDKEEIFITENDIEKDHYFENVVEERLKEKENELNENIVELSLDSFETNLEKENKKNSIIELLEQNKNFVTKINENKGSLNKTGEIIVKTLSDFNIEAKIINYIKGPTVTRFELEINEKVNLVKVEKLKKNIAYNLSASKIRILAPIPGKKAVGIEVPNEEKETVYFDDIFLRNYDRLLKEYELPIILGKDIDGKDWIIDLTETPHLLIAGRTGSGKSVCINSIICSLIGLKTPYELNLILIDPKRVELSLYENLPHNLCEVIINPDLASKALKWLIIEMEKRYELLKNNKCRDIKSYNKIAENKIPYLVLIIDEFYSLMQVAQKNIEESIIRLSSMSRAVGIHLIFATQRPSTDVVTGIIKSNLPSRIAFQTTSKIDSRIILDENGAEELLGNGDMLFSFTGYPPIRIQGALIKTEEVKNIVEKVANDYINYKNKNIIDEINSIEKKFDEEDYDINTSDPLFDEALEIIKNEKKVSASYLQRRLKIGFNRAARLIELMEEKGYISKLKGDKTRDIYI